MRSSKVQLMTEISLSVALALILGQFALFRMPQGGSVSLEMVPIFFVALRRGVGAGVLAGGLVGVLQLVFGGYVLHFIQLLFDYPLPFAVLGIAGLFRRNILIGVIVGSLGRFFFHVVAGAVFWASYAPEGMNPWIYSMGYNATYMAVEVLLALVVFYFLRSRRELFAAE